MIPRFACRIRDDAPPRPVIGIVCCNEVSGRPIQAVATRFVDPLVRHAEVAIVLIPAVADALEARSMASRLDGLLLTGSRSNVASSLYGGDDGPAESLDRDRDSVALDLAARMIEAGRPVFGICRGLQELNVLFGGTLTDAHEGHHRTGDDPAAYETLFDHVHDVDLCRGGMLSETIARPSISVTSVHRQGVDRLGTDLTIEAVATGDGLIEAFSARPCGGDVLAVQWHPEWNADACPANRAFFGLIGRSLRHQMAW